MGTVIAVETVDMFGATSVGAAQNELSPQAKPLLRNVRN